MLLKLGANRLRWVSLASMQSCHKTREVGTGFLVAIPLTSDPSKAYFLLATARHIVDPQWACAGVTNPTLLYARLNKKTYDPQRDESGIDFVKVTLVNNGSPTWRTERKGDY